MNWMDILKRVDIRNADEYERASLDDRKVWHRRQRGSYTLRLKQLQQTANVTNEESPMYKEMIELQELVRFHHRQSQRIRLGYKSKKDFYSLELETDRNKQKGLMTPQGSPMLYTELSQDVYETLTDSEKLKYHSGMANLTTGKEKKFHRRMITRINRKENVLPTVAASKYGGENVQGKDYTSEDYENMSKDNKRKYHGTMFGRNQRDGDKDKQKFHQRMYFRITRNTNLPTYFSPEQEQEAI
mgnify:FL=1